jgi:hypothetical protein
MLNSVMLATGGMPLSRPGTDVAAGFPSRCSISKAGQDAKSCCGSDARRLSCVQLIVIGGEGFKRRTIIQHIYREAGEATVIKKEILQGGEALEDVQGKGRDGRILTEAEVDDLAQRPKECV